MKKCPVCSASCFDDMDVCFGCMHRFNNQDSISENKSDIIQQIPYVKVDQQNEPRHAKEYRGSVDNSCMGDCLKTCCEQQKNDDCISFTIQIPKKCFRFNKVSSLERNMT